MANPLYNPQQNNPFSAMIGQINEFSKTIQGNPKDIVQNLLNSGQMSQEQFNALSQQAQQIMQVMGKK